MGYNEFIRKRTIEMLQEKAVRMAEEIRWLRRRQMELGEDHEHEVNRKITTLKGLKRRIAVLDDYYSQQ